MSSPSRSSWKLPWAPLYSWLCDAVLNGQKIAKADLELVQLCDDPARAVSIITAAHRA
jgi:hypothetical protein